MIVSRRFRCIFLSLLSLTLFTNSSSITESFFIENKKSSEPIYIDETPNLYHVYIANAYTDKRNLCLSGDTLSYNDCLILDCIISNSKESNKLSSEYRLIGHNNEWKETDSKHFEFNNLIPGKYYFEYRVKSQFSFWSNPAVYSFIVESPYWAKSTYIIIFTSIALFFTLLTSFKYFRVLNTRDLIYNNHKYEMSIMKSRMLHSLMSPHFIFNILNSIQFYLFSNRRVEAESNLCLFSNLIRKNLEISKNNFISIHDEVSFLNMYLSLEQKRTMNAFTYEIVHDMEVDGSDHRIPSLMIQPLIENAIIHGISANKGTGKIEVEFFNRQTHVEIVVRDNGVGFNGHKVKNSKSHSSIGLSVINDRLTLMKDYYKFAFHLKFSNLYEDKEGMRGTNVSLTLPLINT